MKKRAKCLIITQGENSSHAIAGREMLRFSKRWEGQVITNMTLLTKETKLDDYDLIFNYCYEDTGVLDVLMPHCSRVIICIGDGFALGDKLGAYVRIPAQFGRIGYVSRDLYDYFSDDPNRQHLYLPHGVDTDLFSPMIGPDKHKKKKHFIIGFVGDDTIESKRFDLANDIIHHDPDYMLMQPTDNTHEEMPDAYRFFDCLVVTSDIEAHL